MRGKKLKGRPHPQPWPSIFVAQILTHDLFAVANHVDG